MLNLFAQKEEAPNLGKLIIFNEDKKTCEILPVDELDDEKIKAGGHIVPIDDVEVALSNQGKVFFLRAPSNIIRLTEHLARVEKNTIVRQITEYRKEIDDEKKSNFMVWGLMALVLVFGIILGVK
jgi:hypothetical protein